MQVEWGTLRLSQLALEVPSVDVRSVKVTLGGGADTGAPRAVPARFRQDGPRCTAQLGERAEVPAGQRLEVMIAW